MVDPAVTHPPPTQGIAEDPLGLTQAAMHLVTGLSPAHKAGLEDSDYEGQGARAWAQLPGEIRDAKPWT